MTEQLISALVIVTGLIAAAAGSALAVSHLRSAGRAYRRTETLYATMPESWSSWFLGGFSGLTMGAHGVWAAAIFVGWTLAGTLLVSLGLRLFWRF
jgi:hypothetical protein